MTQLNVASFRGNAMIRVRPLASPLVAFYLLLVSPHLAQGLVTVGRGDGGKGIPLGDAVMARAKQNLAIAEMANSESLGHVDEVLVTQQQLVARKAVDEATEAFDLARESVPLTKAAETKARLWERDSKVFKKGAEDWLAKMKLVVPEAAKAAAKEIMKQIAEDAKSAAGKANEAAQGWKAKKAERVARNVVAAMQPYHLAMLRQQKGAAMVHAKSMGAIASA